MPPKKNIPERIIVHHSSGAETGPQFDLVDAYHKGRGFQRSSLGYFVGYHYFIEKDGTLRQARREEEMGRHSVEQNFSSIGICLAGNFDEELPTEAQVRALGALLRDVAKRYGIDESCIVPHRAHRDTHCYGLLLTDDWARDVLRTAR